MEMMDRDLSDRMHVKGFLKRSAECRVSSIVQESSFSSNEETSY
jgi:hypothetical protein